MNNLKQSLCLFLVFSTYVSTLGQLPEGYPRTQRQKQNINLGWKFAKNKEGKRPAEINFDDSAYVFDCLLELSIGELESGTYRLETFHHAWEDKKQFPYTLAVEIKSAGQDISFVPGHHIIDRYEIKTTRECASLFAANVFDPNGKEKVEPSLKAGKKEAYTWLHSLILNRAG